MVPKLQPDGTVLVPLRAESPDGTVGDGMIVVRPGEPGYDEHRAAALKAAESQP